jgi:TnpA family transposase
VPNVAIRDATYVLDSLVCHEFFKIDEHFKDPVGFTDRVFALYHLLGNRFTLRMRDLTDKRLYMQACARLLDRAVRSIRDHRITRRWSFTAGTSTSGAPVAA